MREDHHLPFRASVFDERSRHIRFTNRVGLARFCTINRGPAMNIYCYLQLFMHLLFGKRTEKRDEASEWWAKLPRYFIRLLFVLLVSRSR